MAKAYKRQFVHKLNESLSAESPFINAVIGPRQVGKTTGIKQLLAERKDQDFLYCSAEGQVTQSSSWIYEVWTEALSSSRCKLLVIDEIQNVENWSSVVKELWDRQADKDRKLDLIVLGSSSLSISRGLQESLAGRFFVHKVFHWDDRESREAFSMSLEDYLIFGGYPGSYYFTKDEKDWLNYIQNSIVEPVIARDILSQVRVKSAALFKQCFDIVCNYPAQEISYNKLLGQLQDKGNINLVKNYLNLFESAFLLKQLYKYSPKKIVSQSSSPKLLPLCPALFSQSKDANLSTEDRGRAFEVLVGIRLQKLPGSLYYWRDGNYEVDYVYEYQGKIYGIEVKSSAVKKLSGLRKFRGNFPESELAILTPENYNEFIESLE